MKRTLYTTGLWTIGLIFLTAGRINAQGWKRVGNDSTAFSLYSIGSGIFLNLDSSGAPFVFYSDNNNSAYYSIQKFDGASWNLAGTGGFYYPADGEAAAVAPSGNVYLGINDGNYLPEVYAYSGTDWAQVGQGLFAQSIMSYVTPGMAADATGKLYYAIYNANTYNPSVYTYNGLAWVEIGAGELGNGNNGNFVTMAVDHANTPYIVYDESSTSNNQPPTLVVEKFNGTDWVKVGTTTLYSTFANQIIAFDSNNTPYVISGTGTPSAGYNFKLVKLSGGDWVDVGGNISPNPGPPGASIGAAAQGGTNLVQIYLAMDKGDVPLVCYLQNPSMPALINPANPTNPGFSQIIVDKFNGSNWVSASDTAVFTARPDANGIAILPDYNNIAFSSDGKGNVFLGFALQNIMHVYKMVSSLKTPAIHFTAITMTYGDADLAPAATSDNDDTNTPLIYSIADTSIAALLNGKIHIKSAGTTTITVSQTADTKYTAASVTVNLVINKASQTISMAALGTRAISDPDLDPKATASSGLPVSYTTSDPSVATIVNGKIHFLAGGTVIITAHQTGNLDYLAAKDSSQTLVVVAIVTTAIDWDNITKNFGDADFDPGAVSNSPEPLMYTIADGSVAQLLAGKLHILKAGVTNITVTQDADASHTAATRTVQLTIYPAQQTIQFSPFPVKSVLDADFAAGGVSGYGTPFTTDGLPVSYTSSDPSVASVVDGIIHILSAGSTIITASQPGNGNYLAAPDVAQTLSVIQDSQFITFPPIDAHMLGDANFNPGATASSGLLVTYTSSDPTIASIVNDQLHLLKTGTVLITAHQSGNSAYQAANDAYQVLTINPRADSPYPSTDSLVAYCTSSSSLQVNIFSTMDKQATILLYDLGGHRDYNMEVSLSGSLTNSYILAIGNLPAGIYILRVVGPDTRLSQKIRIIR